MWYRMAAVSLLAASMLCAASKKSGAAKNENESVELSATAYLDPAEIKQLVGSDLEGHYIVVQVRVGPRFGKEMDVRRDDFLLRTDKDGERTKPFVPSQIAGRGALVISPTSGGGGMMGDSGPSWGAGPFGGGGGFGNGGDPGGATAKMNTGSKDKESPLLKALAEKMLAEKKTEEPVSGLLYFPLEKQKLKDLELVYTTASGKLSLRFR
jgi:hypothetical protein